MTLSRSLALILFITMLPACSPRNIPTAVPAAGPAPELRALWVDGFHAGIRYPQEVVQLVADDKRAHINALIVQVRRRGDALYAKSFEPPAQDPAYDGMSFFPYASMYAAPQPDSSTPPAPPVADRFDFLSQGENAPFARTAPVPPMPWIDRPVAGWIAGTAVGPDGEGIDGARVELRRAGWWPFRRTLRTVTDGNGWFGFADVAPGRYQVRLPGGAPTLAEVEAGRVKSVQLRVSTSSFPTPAASDPNSR
jgi:hypothetical protein